jgi:hypothetical protein
VRVVENTDARLTVEQRPWGLAAASWLVSLGALYGGASGSGAGSAGERLLVLALGLGCGAAAWWFFPFRRYVFDRADGLLHRTEWRPLWTRGGTMPLAGIRRARQQAHWSEHARLTRLALELDDQTVPLDLGYGSIDLDPVEDAINEWLSRPA